jgi:serine phosphatase RsbU (regulator of sigma subunit)
VKNNLDVPLQITHFGFYLYQNGKWVLQNVNTSAEFSKRYDDGDSTVDGWIPPGKVAVAENLTHWQLLPSLPMKLTYTAQDSAGNMYHAEEEIRLTPEFRYHAGDDTAWAALEFDDRFWESTNTWFQPINPPKSGWNGIGWFRLHLVVDSTLWNQPLALNMLQQGASEIYLDGKLLAQFGKVGSSLRDEEGYIATNKDYLPPPQSIVFRKTNHVIAIRFSNFFFKEKYPHYEQGFGVLFGDLNHEIAARAKPKRFTANIQMLLTVVPMVFGLLHLLLFLFYQRAKENLYYAIFTLTLGVFDFLILERNFFFVTNLRQALLVLDLQNEIALFALVAGLRFLYAVFYPRLPKQFWLFLLAGIGVGAWLWDRPSFPGQYFYGFIMITFVEILRVTVVALLKKKEGAWIIGIGFLFFTAGGSLVVFPEMGILSLGLMAIIAFFSFGMFGLILSMSVFLARNFALTNKNLEVQLIQVKALSEKTIQQEREKAQLEAENVRKTQELEKARQLQLSMLPKNPPALPNLDIAAEMKTATEVGGDYYDFKVHDDGVLTIAVGDATGHGMQAGTMVAATKSLFNALADEPEPASILQKATKALKEMGYRKMYMALTIAKIQNHHMLVAAAGMPYTLIHRAAGGDVEEVAIKAMPLGSFPNFKYEQKKIALEPGDTVLFLSDGLEEMFDPQGEILGAARVKELVVEAGQKPSEQVIAHLKNAGKAWASGRAQEDDVTMVVVKVT